MQLITITALSSSWLSFTTTVGKLSIPLTLSKLNDQRQWFYLKNDNDENVIGILTSLYCEVSDSFLTNNTLNLTKGNIYPRAELSCENLHSNLINTLLNRTINAKESNHQCSTSNKMNNICYIGSCDYTNDRTIQKDDIKSTSNNVNSHMNTNVHLPTEAPIRSCTSNNAKVFSHIYTDRNISFQTTNQSLQSIEAILNQIKDNSYIESNHSLGFNGEFIQRLSNKIKTLYVDEEELNNQTIINNQLNEKIKEKENILKRERNKLEDKYRKYKESQAEYETKSLNLAQSNIQFENDQSRFSLEKEIFAQDQENSRNISIMFASTNYKNIIDCIYSNDDHCIYDTAFPVKSMQKSKTMQAEQRHALASGIFKKKKEIILENPLNYNVTKSKSKPNSTGSTTNYTSGHNSDITSNDSQNVFYNTSICQEINCFAVNNTKYFAPIAEINLTNSNYDQRDTVKTEVFNTNPLIDSLECGTANKKVPANIYMGRSTMRKNSKLCTNGSNNLYFVNEVNVNNSRKKSVKNPTIHQIKKIAMASSAINNNTKGERSGIMPMNKKDSGIKSDTITNTVMTSLFTNTNVKTGLRLSKKNK